MKRALSVFVIVVMLLTCHLSVFADEKAPSTIFKEEQNVIEPRRGPLCICGDFMEYYRTDTGVEYYDGTQNCIHKPKGLDEIYKTKITEIYKCPTCQRTREYLSYRTRLVCKGSY